MITLPIVVENFDGSLREISSREALLDYVDDLIEHSPGAVRVLNPDGSPKLRDGRQLWTWVQTT